MGLEAVCVARHAGNVSEGKLHLETNDIRFRGEFRLTIPLESIESVAAEDGLLTLAFSGGQADFSLGMQATRWADKIRNPPSLIDKLDVKSGARVSVLGVDDTEFLAKLEARTSAITRHGVAEGSDFIFFQADHPADLDRIAALRDLMPATCALWVTTPRGTSGLRDVDVMAAGKANGLVDVKVARFSSTHTALKFVIPKAMRSSLASGGRR